MLNMKTIQAMALKKARKKEKRELKKFEKMIDERILLATKDGRFNITLKTIWGYSEGEKNIINSYVEKGGFKVDCFYSPSGARTIYEISWEVEK